MKNWPDRFAIILLTLLTSVITPTALAQTGTLEKKNSPTAGSYQTKRNILYRSETDQVPLTDYMRSRCTLDIYYPEGLKNFPTIVWFHAGGLTSGQKEIPKALKNQGFAVIGVNYRLSPKVKSPAYVDDAAAAVAWTLRNITRYGGDKNKVFVCGHSAGGYLASMVGLDQRWLKKHGMNADKIAGIVAYSGHSITHFTIRKERGIDGKQAVVDDMAPLFHVRKDAPPMLLITGDRKMEMLGRYEETAYFWRMMKVVGHKDCTLRELQGFDHGGVVHPAHALLIRFVKKRSGN